MLFRSLAQHARLNPIRLCRPCPRAVQSDDPGGRSRAIWSLATAAAFGWRSSSGPRGFTGFAQAPFRRLIEHLERPGYVVMCKPGLAPHTVDLGTAIARAARFRREE